MTRIVDLANTRAVKESEIHRSIHNFQLSSNLFVQLTVAGTVGAAGQCTHTVPARAEKGTRHWSDQGRAGDHPQRTGGGTALDKAQREVHTRAVLSDLAKVCIPFLYFLFSVN